MRFLQMSRADEQPLPHADASPKPRRVTARRRLARVSIVIAVLALAVGGLWTFRVPILQSAVDAWVVSDPLEEADAVVVLGGGVNTRPFAAADIYRAGLTKIVLLSEVKPSRVEIAQVVALHNEINQAVLIKRGVPGSAIVLIGKDIINTRDEAAAVGDWATANGAKKIILVTEKIPSRRVKWVFTRALGRIGVKTIVYTVPELDFDYRRWWEDERGIIGFQNEVMKYIYYRLKY